ncbi:hypothetical protein ACHAPT_012632 [Fusarium lateritium]
MDRNPRSQVPENALIDKYVSACLQDDEEEVDLAQDQLLDAINEAGQALLDQLAPPDAPSSTDLHSTLFPQQFSFKLVTVGGEPKLFLEGSHRFEITNVPGKGYESALPVAGFQLPNTKPPALHFRLDTKEPIHLPKYSTKDIQIVQRLFGEGYISHVSVDGREMCAKIGQDFDGGALQREFESLLKVSSLSLQHPSRVNVPKLLGLVETPDDGKVIGILEELIPHPEGEELSSLAMIDDVELRVDGWTTI